MKIKLETMWEIAAKDLGLTIKMPFVTTLSSGSELKSLFLIENFGGKQGIVVTSSFDSIEHLIDEMILEGYAFSTLSEPLNNEVYNRKEYIELLSEWGWSGAIGNKPKWIMS